MLLLGWMTIQHVRIRPARRITNSKDRQLTIMLIVQVFCVVILTLPISVQKTYALLTVDQPKSVERTQIEGVIANLVVIIALINTSTSFYLFTLTSRIFRKELKPLLCLSKRRQACIGVNIAVLRKKP
jgi:hypothetical protein